MPTVKQIIEAGKADDVVSLIKRRIRTQFSDDVENKSDVYAKSGKIYVSFEADGIAYSFAMQRRSVPKFLKMLRSL